MLANIDLGSKEIKKTGDDIGWEIHPSVIQWYPSKRFY